MFLYLEELSQMKVFGILCNDILCNGVYYKESIFNLEKSKTMQLQWKTHGEVTNGAGVTIYKSRGSLVREGPSSSFRPLGQVWPWQTLEWVSNAVLTCTKA